MTLFNIFSHFFNFSLVYSLYLLYNVRCMNTTYMPQAAFLGGYFMQEYDQMLHALTDLLLSTELGNSDIATLHEGLQAHLKPLAESLHVAKVDGRIDFAPNVHDLNGGGETFGSVYSDDAGEEPLVLSYSDLFMVSGSASLYPCAGYVWSEEEKSLISAVSMMIALQFSRMSMVNRIDRLSYIDMFTGLLNSQGVIRYGSRYEKDYSIADYAGCFINLKNLKYINQQLSSNNGDAVIRQYALRLYGFIDHRDEMAARLGGDNFFVLIRKERLERLLSIVSALNIILNNGGARTRLIIESWVGVYPANEGDPIGMILSNASFANEQAKRTHTPVTYYDPSAMEHLMHARQIAHALPNALRTQELVAFYQPKVDANTGDLCGGEALVRWIKDGAFISPSEFIPAAEASGMITQLDLYMLESVCKDLRSWIDAGIEPVRISVNYSQNDFHRNTLIEDTLNILQKYCIDGKYLEIEITESSFFDSFRALESFIRAMHEHGVKVSLDDFGTGYSSLNMLKSLDLDTVKLDKSFFDELNCKDEADRVVLRSVADMLSQLNKTAVSEGIETYEQIEFAREIGCDIIQGYFFDEPLSYDEFTSRLLSRHYDTIQP